MLKRCLTLALVVALVHLTSAAPAVAKSKEDREAQRVEKVRAGILKLGTGGDARVKVELRDKTKLEGFIKEAGADSFTVVETKTGAATAVPYPQVARVKGNNLATGVKIAIGVGVAVLVFLVVVFAKMNADRRR
jgi:hypothetical protein